MICKQRLIIFVFCLNVLLEQNGYVCQKVKSKHFTDCDETIDERELLAVDLCLFYFFKRFELFV